MIRIDEKHTDVIAFRQGKIKLRELLVQHSAKRTEVEQLEMKYLQARRLPRAGKLEAEAHALLVGSNEPDLGPDDIERARHDVEVLGLAVEKQRQIVDNLHGRYSLHVNEANRARYVEIEKRISRGVTETAEANEEEFRFSKRSKMLARQSVFAPCA